MELVRVFRSFFFYSLWMMMMTTVMMMQRKSESPTISLYYLLSFKRVATATALTLELAQESRTNVLRFVVTVVQIASS
jgi:hypothetical protein